MKFENFIARRYLVSKHKVNFITIISVLSICGITIGVAALIVVLSVFNGFGSLVTSFLINFDPHVRVEILNPENQTAAAKLDSVLNRNTDVVKYSPYVTGKVLVYRDELFQIVNLKGIDVSSGESIYDIEQSMLYGKYSLGEKGRYPEMVLGLHLADKLQTLIGDTLTLLSPAGIEKAVTQFSSPKTQQFILSGIYSTTNNEYDDSYIFTDLKYAQDLLGYKNHIQGYDVRLNNIDESFEVKAQLQKELNAKDYRIETWYDFHRDLYSVMQIERWTAYIILCLIIAVASFNILGSLSMSVIEKKRDIGVLNSMGAQQKSILRIFMYEGILIGIIGTIAGLALGYFICFLQLKFNIYPLDPTQYKIDSLPLQLRLSDFFYVSGASLLLTFLASLFPAKRAAKINTIEAIKWE
jgi:lipoprotein-releasing system permease protein